MKIYVIPGTHQYYDVHLFINFIIRFIKTYGNYQRYFNVNIYIIIIIIKNI